MTETQQMEALSNRLSACKWAILKKVDAFIGYLSMSLPTYIDVGTGQPDETAYTNYKSYVYYLDFCSKLTDAELTFLVIHETLHVLYKHNHRRGHRDNLRWNYAADYAINASIQQITSHIPEVSMIKGALYKDKYRDKTAEIIYDLMPNGEESNGGGPGLLDPKTHANEVKVSDVDMKTLQRALATSILKAKEYNKARGLKPSGFQRDAEEGLKPIIDWRKVFRATVQSFGFSNITYRQPSRRTYALMGAGLKLFIPKNHGYAYPTTLIVQDTSGSISQDFLNAFLAEAQGLLNTASEITMHYWSCDAAVYKHGIYHAGQHLKKEYKGGGGTDFRPAFQEANRIKGLKTLIFFSDTMGTFPDTKPKFNTIFLVPHTVKNPQVPAWVKLVVMSNI